MNLTMTEENKAVGSESSNTPVCQSPAWQCGARYCMSFVTYFISKASQC